MRGLVVALLGFSVSLAACDPTPRAAAGSAQPDFIVSAEPVRIEFPLPEFTLVDQRDRKVTRDSLLGKVSVVDFIFTTCASVCPRLTQTMAGFTKRFEADADVLFLSITVDPENDTSEKLAAFAAKYQVNPDRWWFLTGEPSHVEATVIKGFKMAVRPVGPNVIDHAERFVVVDKRARVRGVFDTDEAGLKQLELRVRDLQKE